MSKRVDNTLILELEQIDIRHEDNRLATFLFHGIGQIAVNLDFHRSGTVSTFRVDDNPESLPS